MGCVCRQDLSGLSFAASYGCTGKEMHVGNCILMLLLYNKLFGICKKHKGYKNEVNGLVWVSPGTGLDHLSGQA